MHESFLRARVEIFKGKFLLIITVVVKELWTVIGNHNVVVLDFYQRIPFIKTKVPLWIFDET